MKITRVRPEEKLHRIRLSLKSQMAALLFLAAWAAAIVYFFQKNSLPLPVLTLTTVFFALFSILLFKDFKSRALNPNRFLIGTRGSSLYLPIYWPIKKQDDLHGLLCVEVDLPRDCRGLQLCKERRIIPSLGPGGKISYQMKFSSYLQLNLNEEIPLDVQLEQRKAVEAQGFTGTPLVIRGPGQIEYYLDGNSAAHSEIIHILGRLLPGSFAKGPTSLQSNYRNQLPFSELQREAQRLYQLGDRILLQNFLAYLRMKKSCTEEELLVLEAPFGTRPGEAQSSRS